jgi:non-ribosomal peptide synthetase component F/thioesterase domain-containing protein/acyl carrier protein
VQIPHRALLNFLLAMLREPGLTADDVILAVTTLSFDIAGLELLLPLIVGARVEIATREEASDAELLKKRLAGVTVLQATPASWRMLLDAGWEGGDLKALCGGEALPSDLAAKLLPRVSSLWNMYGPTETTIYSATRQVAHEEEGTSIAVGGPIANTQLYVLDRRLEPVPIGVPGELCIGGEGLARGYLGSPDLTAERFVPDPFAGGRMYRTGDLARWRPDGAIEFLGRIDFQVKVRGFRIELGEIEAALVAHPAVRQAVAGLRGDRLVAWVVAEADADLREHLKGRLPDYMIPAAFVKRDAFPLTPSGKVDRKALPEPEIVGGERGWVAPRGPVEELIAGIWSELLNVERVGAEDSFFELGGHSLLATQVASRLRRVFGVDMPVRQLFETPVLSQLAERVQAARQGGDGIPPLRPMPRPDAIPLSYAQERLWFVEQLEGDPSMYNLPAAVRLRGELRVDAFEACLREIVRRHEALRTRFVTVQGQPAQVIDEHRLLALPVVDLRGLPPAAVEMELRRRTTEDEHRPYDLAAGPLVRATLLRLADTDSVVLFGMHHIVSDRWSMGLLLGEMGALYPAFAAGEPSPLPALPVQYADYSLWQREWLRGEALDAQLGYWTGKLGGLQPLDLPTDRDAAPGQVFRAGDLTFELEAPVAEALYALARSQGASPFMVLLAAFQALLQRHSGQEDVAVGAPIAGRTRSEAEDLIGFFVNTLVLRTRVEPGLSFRELLDRVRATTLEAYDHQDLPFSRVVDALRPSRRQGLGLVDVMFTMQNQPMPDLSLPGLGMSVLPISDEAELRINFALSLRMWEAGGRMKGGLSYNTAQFDPATAERWRDGFLTLLAAVVEQPEQAISEVPLPGVGERRQVAIPEPGLRPAAVSESVAKQRAEMTSRRDHLSAAKRELLEKRLRGAKAGAGAAIPAQTARARALVKLQEGDGSRPPFFCVHAIGGSVFSYGELARALGSAQAFYGVQSPGLEGGPLPDEVPAMAAAYLAEIETAAPAGPVLLGGWSFGGAVAFEMARQLRARGREVPLVVLLDSYAPSGEDLLAGRSDADLLAPFLRDQAGLQGRGAEWLDEIAMAGEGAVMRMLEQARMAGVLRSDIRSEKAERLLGVYKANLRALSSYRPQPYDGRILLFRSDGADARHPANGWEGLAGEPIETQPVSGDHYTMLALPHVVQLANRLAARIELALRARADANAEAGAIA